MMIEEEKSKIEETCDVCNIPLTHREDDNEEAFKFRYQTYLNETEPLIHFYQEKGLLSTIDATSPVEDVFKKVEEELDPLQ
jgi:adenylate kinase